MVDKIILELPADTVGGDIVVSTETRERAETAAAASEEARDQAQVYAANTVELQDTTFTALIADPESETRAQLNATIGQAVDALNLPGTYAPISVLASQMSLPTPQPPLSVVTSFQAGHGFAKTASTNADHLDLNHVAEDSAIGTQYVRVMTDGAGTGVLFEKSGFAPSDLLANRVALMVRVDDPTRLSGLQIYAYSGASDYAVYSANVYLNGRGTTLPGEWSPVYFTDAARSSTVGAYDPTGVTRWRVRVADNSSGPVVVDINQIATFPIEAISADGPIVTFTFDDGYKSHRTIAAREMAVYGWAGDEFPIASSSIAGGANSLTVAQMRELQNLYRWGFGGHAYSATMHNSSGGYTDFTDAQVAEDILANITWLQESGLSWTGMFAWSSGGVDPAKYALAKRYYSMGRSSMELPMQTALPDRPLDLRSVGVTAARSGTDYQAFIDKAAAGNGWLIFRVHDIADSGATGTTVSTAVFKDLLARVAASGARVMTMGQVARAIAASG